MTPGGSASVYVLHDGYVGRDGDDERVAGTVTLIMDGDAVIVVDPGMVASREGLLAALADRGPVAADVTDVVFMPSDVGVWVARRHGLELVAGARTPATPPRTSRPSLHRDRGNAWWGDFGPPEDPLGADAAALHASRDVLLEFATLIVPGHGPAFRPGPSTPR